MAVDVVGAAKVLVETVVDAAQAKQAGKKTGDAIAEGVGDAGEKGGETFAAGLGKKLLVAGGAAGLGAAIGDTFMEALERESNGARLVASLGGSAKDIAALNKTASDIYAQNWGESFEQVQAGVAATKSSFQNLDGAELAEAAENAQIFADIFGIDVVDAVGAASVAVSSGLAENAVQALDLMTATLQQVPFAFRGEVIEAVQEYSEHFVALGLDGAEAFGLIAEEAKLGQYGIDKAGDAIKEFAIKATDGSATSLAAFDTIGLNATEMGEALAAGGDQAEEAFRQIVTGLDQIKDPLEQRRAAIGLFGTPLEDLSQTQLPAFVHALAEGSGGLENFEGALEDAGRTAGNTQGGEFKAALRGLGEEFIDLADKITRAINKFNQYKQEVYGKSPKGTAPGNSVSQPRDTYDFKAAGGPASGWTVVGEEGPELVDLPGGSFVHTAGQTREMLGGGVTNLVVNLNGPADAAQVAQEVNWALQHSTRFGALTGARGVGA